MVVDESDVFTPRGSRETLGSVSAFRRSFAACMGPLVLLSAVSLGACKTDSGGAGGRQWVRCTCSYISDFDEPGAAPIEVCSDERQAEEVASTCVRNDGVGIPTSCGCDRTPRGACEKADRCRPVSTPTR